MIRARGLLLLLVIVGLSHFRSNSPAVQMWGTTRQVASAAAQQPAPKPELFRFQNNFWVNLHDLLYWHAQTPQCAQGQINGECAHYYDITPADEGTWRQAVNWYAANLAKRSPVLDDEMVRVDNTLAELGEDANLDHRGLPEGLVDSLRIAAPVFRKYYWPDQEFRDHKWLAAVTPKVEKYGEAVAQQLAAIYGEHFPAGVRVDVVMFAGPLGAYSTLGPPHIVVSSVDPRNVGDSGFEVLFHEASHAMLGKLQPTIAREFRLHGKGVPQDLWHALVFYTTGEVVKRKLLGYTPYADRNGLYKQHQWAQFKELLERDWKPVIDGKVDRDSAIAKIAEEY